jgi:hypothetical protein
MKVQAGVEKNNSVPGNHDSHTTGTPEASSGVYTICEY